jgi:hypothetical protein
VVDVGAIVELVLPGIPEPNGFALLEEPQPPRITAAIITSAAFTTL